MSITLEDRTSEFVDAVKVQQRMVSCSPGDPEQEIIWVTHSVNCTEEYEIVQAFLLAQKLNLPICVQVLVLRP